MADKSAGLFLSRFAQISRRLGKIIDHRLQPIGISYQEMRIAGLMMGEKEITQKQLADKLSVRAATLSVAISKLERTGLVKRRPNPADKRANFLSLHLGAKKTKVDRMLVSLEAEILEGLSKKDLVTADAVIEKVLNNIHKLEEGGRL